MFVKVSSAGALGLFYGYFKTFHAVAFPPPQKNLDVSSIVLLVYY